MRSEVWDEPSKFLWQMISDVKNPILYDYSKLPTSLPDGLLEDGKIPRVQIIWE